jgi:hypothetical protein
MVAAEPVETVAQAAAEVVVVPVGAAAVVVAAGRALDVESV